MGQRKTWDAKFLGLHDLDELTELLPSLNWSEVLQSPLDGLQGKFESTSRQKSLFDTRLAEAFSLERRIADEVRALFTTDSPSTQCVDFFSGSGGLLYLLGCPTKSYADLVEPTPEETATDFYTRYLECLTYLHRAAQESERKATKRLQKLVARLTKRIRILLNGLPLFMSAEQAVLKHWIVSPIAPRVAYRCRR